MPNEYITYEQVKSGAEQLRKCANTMEDIFNNVTGNMRTMTTTENFQGAASNELSAEFEQFRGGFNDYVTKVRDFATAFESAAEALQANEEMMKKQVSNIGE